MIIDCISDLHGSYPTLEGGDLLIVAGDLTAAHRIEQFREFDEWLWEQDYTMKVFIAGNHDGNLKEYMSSDSYSPDCERVYLEDSGTEFMGLKIWGTPWTAHFFGVAEKCDAFMLPDAELAPKWEMIPSDTDILITHSPPRGFLDEAKESFRRARLGSYSLRNAFNYERFCPKLWVFGHIHNGYGEISLQAGKRDEPQKMIVVNAAHMNEDYEPVNPPIRVVL